MPRYKPSRRDWLSHQILSFKDDPSAPWDSFPCVLWPFCVGPSGYGLIGKGGSPTREARASREAWRIAKGDIPDGLCVLHRCDVLRCIRPSHLFLGTRGDNARDRDTKGRGLPCGGKLGEEHHSSKLTEDQVREIRCRLEARETMNAIGRAFGVTHGCIRMIATNQSWKWLT